MGVSQWLEGRSTVAARSRRRLLACAWLLAALVVVPGIALALGLGQLVVKSQPGQPLVAEIPIVAANRDELENLQVRLASPETFRRVGLQPPDATVANLQFTVAVDGRGRPVIRVTSATPPTQPVLAFLLEVDWGEGRLVREYSALIDAPETLAAPVQAIQAPVVAPANTIERPVPPPAPAVAEPEIVAEALPPQPQPPAPVAAAEPVPTPAPPAAPPRSDYTVRAGDTLGAIARGFDRSGRSLDQAMLALLRANPDAFIGGNINRVRQGAVLRMPQAEELSRYSAGEAAAMVRAQVTQWRGQQVPQLQPQDTASAVAAAVPEAGRSDAATAVPGSEARLEIVPPSSGGGAAKTRSGIQAGGEGPMLRQEIQETQETLAARDVEVGELKTRVAELEKIQQQQQQLISMKDSALAAARENLAKANAGTTKASVPPPTGATSGPTLWPWLLLGLALALLAAWWFMRRRGLPSRPRLFDTAALASGIPKAAPAPVAAAPVVVEPIVVEPIVVEPVEVLTPARQVELARAYLDLGDDAAAGELLREVLDSRDPVSREIAARMLREME